MGQVLANMVLAESGLEAALADPKSKGLDRKGKSTLVHELREVGNADGIPILTIETRIEQRKFAFPGAPGSEVNNLGFNQTWQHRAQTKNKQFQKYLDEHMDTPDMLVVLVDGGDVLWGGCDPSVLRSTYEKTVKAAGGAKIVLGAEFGIGPSTMLRTCLTYQHLREPYESIRAAVLKETGRPAINRSYDFSFHEALFGNWTQKNFSWIDDMYADRSVCNHKRSFCSTPPRYQFANYGFVMGPVSALKPFIDEINSVQDQQPDKIDQEVALKYHLGHPDLLTLDYSGTLMLSLHNFIGDMQAVTPPFLKFDVKKRKVFNEITGNEQCFLHGNGRAKRLIWKMAEEMNNMFKPPNSTSLFR